jgi:hypothetical protein
VVATNLTIAIAVWNILSSTASRIGLAPAAQRSLRIGSALFLGGWLGTALVLAPVLRSLFPPDRFAIPPVLSFGIVAVAIALVAVWASSSLRRVLAAASLPTLVGVQLYRIIGAVFLVLLVQGQLPAHFALPAGWGDVAIGIAAPLVALALARGVRGSSTLAVSWNVLGLVDLVVAVGMGAGFLAPILAPDLGRVGPAAAMQMFPMILVPAFAVPVSVLLHLIALGGLRRRVGLGSGVTASAAR